jgi:hypothetical protein
MMMAQIVCFRTRLRRITNTMLKNGRASALIRLTGAKSPYERE